MSLEKKYMKCFHDLPLIEAAKLLIGVGKRNLIIINDTNKMLGTISSSDILKFIISNDNFQDYNVADVMVKDFIYVREGTSKEKMIQIFKSTNVNYLPVLDNQKMLKDIILVSELL